MLTAKTPGMKNQPCCSLNGSNPKLPNFGDTFLLRLKRKEDRDDFKRYCESTMSYYTMSVVFAVISVYGLNFVILSVRHTLVPDPLMIILLCLFLIWVTAFATLFGIHFRKVKLSEQRTMSTLIENFLMVLGTISIGISLLYRVANGQCKDYHFVNIWHCNTNAVSLSLPADFVVMLMLYPIIFPCIYKSIQFETIIGCWLLNIIIFLVAINVPEEPLNVSYTTLTYYVPASLILICDLQRQNLSTYFMSCQQKYLLHENVRLAEESHVEMRHMIGNVAHDLKTPLASLLTGIEMISSHVQELHNISSVDNINSNNIKDYTGNKNQAFTCVSEIQSFLADVKNVNDFMIMTINRCIDYTKSSNGFKLVPKFETVKLSDVLHLPMKCMNDMQKNIAVAFKTAIPNSICSHIITDKQWLQENILCLLSNAVKYSNGGEVTVNVSMLDSAEDEGRVSEKRLEFIAEQKAIRERVPVTPRNNGEIQIEPFAAAAAAAATTRKHLYDLAPAVESGGFSLAEGSAAVKDKPEYSRCFFRFPCVTAGNVNSNKIAASTDSGRMDQMAGSDITVPRISAPGLASSDIPMLLFEIEDTGIGISDDMMSEQLFTPFKQTQRHAGGTGLGLFSLARRIEALGGHYGVESRPDGQLGSLFWFTIPYRPDAAAGLTSAGMSPVMSSDDLVALDLVFSTEGSPGSHKTTVEAFRASAIDTQHSGSRSSKKKASLRMLVVDDSLAILKMTSMMLRKQGHTVTQAKNGAEALELLNKALLGTSLGSASSSSTDCDTNDINTTAFDVVLMDLQMPVMDGLEATRRYREVEKEANQTRIEEGKTELHQLMISFSANSDDMTMSEALAVGFDAFISKPFTLETFNNVCAKYFSKLK